MFKCIDQLNMNESANAFGTLKYRQFDPTGCDFPAPRIPVLPGLSWHTFGRSKNPSFVPVDDGKKTLHFSRGRYALTHAYKLAGVGPKGALLAPAYHCRTMVDPAIRLGSPLSFFRLTCSLAPDIDDLLRTIPHYFGFPQDLNPLVRKCLESGISLIEDCSHAMFAPKKTATSDSVACMGHYGRFAIASPYKFFASEDGGLFWSNDIDIEGKVVTSAKPVADELRALRNMLSRFQIQDHKLPTLGQLKASIGVAQTVGSIGSDKIVFENTHSHHYQVSQELHASLKTSRWIIRHSDSQRVIDLRRRNFLKWLEATQDLSACKPLFPNLSDNVVPYMFPLILKNPHPDFFRLKRLGIPIWRWDDMAFSDCKIAQAYRLDLIHLPCHQELTQGEMNWMTKLVRSVLSCNPKDLTA
jgi:perosamine synthetase